MRLLIQGRGYQLIWVNLLVHFIIIWLLIILIVYIRKTSFSPTVKYSINFAAIILIFLLVLRVIGFYFQLSVIFSVIEWATKFILPWIALYWLVRAIKGLDKKS